MWKWLAIVGCTPQPSGRPNEHDPFTVEPGPQTEDTETPGGTTPDTAFVPDSTISEATGWIAADAGPEATCGVRATRELECWGDLHLIDSTFDVPYGSFEKVAVGDRHVCAITSAPRTLVCFGDDDHGQSSPPAGTGWVEISAGGNHTCARLGTGEVECWGDDSQGQLDLLAVGYDQIAAGYAHTCGITNATGTVQCAGSNAFGESSDPAGFGSSNTSVAAGRYVTCAITSNDYGSACAGDAADLQLSDQYIANTDIAVGGGFVAVLAGQGYDNRTIHGRGNVPWDDLDGPVESTSWYGDVLPSARYSSITAGDRHLCLLAPASNDLFCLGDDSQGQVAIPP